MTKKVYIKTLGCRLNTYDSDGLANKLLQHNYSIVENEKEADICVVNTCTVTHSADRKSKQAVMKLKRENSDSKMVVMGCGVQLSKNRYETIDEVDFIGKSDAQVLTYLLGKNTKSLENKQLQKIDQDIPEKSVVNGTKTYSSRTRALVQIQTGCDNYCTFCIIPFTRGSSVNHNEDIIIKNIQKKVDEGAKEVVLTGVNIGAYGAKNTVDNLNSKFPQLLKRILNETTVERIRLSSMGPEYFSDELIEMFKNPRICNHIHLSIQYGEDYILRRMNRKYDTAWMYSIVEKLYEVSPNIAFSTDIIVGFPGETDEIFQKNCEFLSNIKIAKVHAFKYSKRRRTLAATYVDQVDEFIKKERSKVLRNLASDLSSQFVERQLGQKIQVLWEKFDEETHALTGITDNYLQVTCIGERSKLNTLEYIVLDSREYTVSVAGV